MFQWLRRRRDGAVAPAADLSRRAAGARVEDAVADWLGKQGCQALARNFQVRGGELDLVVLDAGSAAFVEVRYRLHGGIEAALQSVGRLKQQRLIRAARAYLRSNRQLQSLPCRFDVVAVSGVDGDFEYRWIKDAFRVDD